MNPKTGLLVLEIGFGMGEATAHIAALMPDTRFLCCEVHHARRGRACSNASANRACRTFASSATRRRGGDGQHATARLRWMVCTFSSPTPGTRKKHNKRRLIQAAR